MEAMTEILPPNTREDRAVQWKEKDPIAVSQMQETAKSLQITLTDYAFGSGGILEPTAGVSPPENKNHFTASRQKAVVLGRTYGSNEPNVVFHFPTHLESGRHDATFTSYQEAMGEYLRSRWDPDAYGMNPLPGVVGSKRLEDGRYAVAVRFRRNFEPLGAENFATGIHVLNTNLISPTETRNLVQVLDAIHVDAKAFQTWIHNRNIRLPKESWLHPENAGYAFRGQEWWMSPLGEPDRLKELTNTAVSVEDLYKTIDPAFDVKTHIGTFIRNNISLFPHVNGSVDDPRLVGDAVVVHGSLCPDNIHIRRNVGGKINFTISGGDRAQGYGLRGQMIDWLVTSTAGSPEHQRALIDEFISLHPTEKDRRGLAMHVLYRSIMETPWFLRSGRLEEAKNLATLTHDIVTGTGVWTGTDKPLTGIPS